ncbi:MAG: hypothetical protein NXY57DRAFT_1038730 [Lentinula lateritia]|nr:MAG: hypothetical protein NXY57DRAFT_1038730 [Lentinula lateritia]
MSTNYSYLPGCIKTPSFENRSKPGGVYDKITTGFMRMGANAIANAELNQDLFRFNFAQAWSSNYSFRGIDSKQYMGNVFGEIVGQAHGTHIGAQGNHFAGNDPTHPRLLDDYTKTKCTIVLGCPSFATPAISDLFYNQICTLSSVRDADKEEEIRSDLTVIPKEMVKSLKPGGDLDGIICMVLRCIRYSRGTETLTMSTLVLPHPSRREILRSVIGPHPMNTNQNNAKTFNHSRVHQSLWFFRLVYVGAEYDHRLMPDFGGPVFVMKKAKLIQPQWTNINNDLIVPWEYYNYLRPGTVVVATICIEVFVMPVGTDAKTLRKIYHASITSLKVVAQSELVVLPPTPSIMKKNTNRSPELSSAAATALAAIDWSTSSTSPSASSSDHTLDDANDKVVDNEQGNSGQSSSLKDISGVAVPGTKVENRAGSGECNAIEGDIENTGESCHPEGNEPTTPSTDNGNSFTPVSLAKRNLKERNPTTSDNDGTQEDEDDQCSVCTMTVSVLSLIKSTLALNMTIV